MEEGQQRLVSMSEAGGDLLEVGKMQRERCPACGGNRLLPNGEICEECTRGMIVVCEDCKIRAIDKGHIPTGNSSELSDYVLYQCPSCMSVGIINTYSKNWYDG